MNIADLLTRNQVQQVLIVGLKIRPKHFRRLLRPPKTYVIDNIAEISQGCHTVMLIMKPPKAKARDSLEKEPLAALRVLCDGAVALAPCQMSTSVLVAVVQTQCLQ
jgi:hypothetical protein